MLFRRDNTFFGVSTMFYPQIPPLSDDVGGSTPGQVLLIGQVRLIALELRLITGAISAINRINRIIAPQTAINWCDYAINRTNRTCD